MGVPAGTRTDGVVSVDIRDGWTVTAVAPGSAATPAELQALESRRGDRPDALRVLPAQVPGTAASALQAAGQVDWALPAGADVGAAHPDLDAQDWWFRTELRLPPPDDLDRVVLCLDGVATRFDVFLDERLLGSGSSMWEPWSAVLSPDGDASSSWWTRPHRLVIRCHALGPLLQRPVRPRARWRTALAANGLRAWRTTLLGRMPGISDGPAAVGPWRPVRVERRRGPELAGLRVRSRMEDGGGVVTVRARLRDGGPRAGTVRVTGPDGAVHEAPLAAQLDGHLSGRLRIPDAPAWWPHTHGTPHLHAVELQLGDGDGHGLKVDAGRVGFVEVAAGPPGHDVEADGLALRVNGVPVFARGAVWTPVDPIGLGDDEGALRATLEQVVAAGMNLLRIPGIGVYESPAFHRLCDELGILVWQDLMLATFDLPLGEPGFTARLTSEVERVLDDVGAHPSLAVLCGSSELEQQVAMLGLNPALGRLPFLAETVPAALAAAEVCVPYVRSTPTGGLPVTRPDLGVTHFFGVGAYRRPLTDARRAEVRFAAECLAFANVPEPAVADRLREPDGGLGEGWKAGVPRDNGADWDFEDVRDHYLAELHGVDPDVLRETDPNRYLELSRIVSGEVMAETLGEWRRSASPCGGALVLWLKDLHAGAGWGLLDHLGRPKVALHHVRRILAPVAVWTSDEGLGGVRIHAANDGPVPIQVTLEVALLRDGRIEVARAAESLKLGAHTTIERNVETLLGRFADAAYAHRFGPPPHHDVVVRLRDVRGRSTSESVRHVAPRSDPRRSAGEHNLRVDARRQSTGGVLVSLSTDSLVDNVRLSADGLQPEDDAFMLCPRCPREVLMSPTQPVGPTPAMAVSIAALNLFPEVTVAVV